MTDSGGLQKEAYYLRKNCITLRNETEWNDLVDAGCNKVVGAEINNIEESFPWANKVFNGRGMIYEYGDAGKKIIEIVDDYFLSGVEKVSHR